MRHRVHLVWHAAAFAAAAVLSTASAAFEQSAGRPIAAREAPFWIARPPVEDSQNFFFVGNASSASESQARASAQGDAQRKAVERIAERLYQDPTAPTSYDVAALREYVQKVGKSAGDYRRVDPGGGYTVYVLLQLNKAYLEPTTVRQYAAAPLQQARTAVGYLLIPGRVASTVTTRRTQVRMPNLRQGNFYLYFSVVPGRNGVRIRLDQIQVLDDGSAGATLWAFDVLVNGRKAFSVPTSSYSDEVGTYRMRPNDPGVETQVAGADALIEVKILGTTAGAPASRK